MENTAKPVNTAPTNETNMKNFLLGALSPEVREKVLKDVVCRTIPKNKYIFREGDPADHICIILSGKIKLSHIDSEGRESIVMILSENDTIWESMFLYEGRFPYSAVSMTEVRIVRIYRENFMHILEDPQATLHIITVLSRKLHDANLRNMILHTKDPEARIAGFLLYSAGQGEHPTLTLRLDDIASSISLRPETVSRKLTEMQERRLIKRTGNGRIKILDLAGLTALYHEEEDF